MAAAKDQEKQKPDASKSPRTQVRQLFWEPLVEYRSAVEKTWRDSEARAAKAQWELAKEAQALWEEQTKRAQESQERYWKEVQEAQGSEDAPQRYQKALETLAGELHELHCNPEIARRLEEAQQRYVEELQQALAPEPLQERFEEPYRDYVQACQKAWGKIDGKSLDSGSLSAIGQTLIAGATLAHGTLGSRSSR